MKTVTNKYKPWNLSDLKSIEKNGYSVFSCFHCGGGSTMGYKLSGFDVLGGVEIDKQMMSIYRLNHSPRHSYLMGVGDFNKLPDDQIPDELKKLDILDGSPPCSSFSMAGSREDAWGDKKKFREGQSVQVLDDLFFDFINTAKKLKPKIVVSENVKGLVAGKARGYVKQIFNQFSEAGYDTQLFLLNAAQMGVPQRRERVFFISRRRDLNIPEIKLSFQEAEICFEDIDDGEIEITDKLKISQSALKYYLECKEGKSFSSVHEKGSLFNSIKIDRNRSLNTLASGCAEIFYHPVFQRKLSDREWIRGQSFPDDYNFGNAKAKYVIGMSVPPYMMQRISEQIKKQMLDPIAHRSI